MIKTLSFWIAVALAAYGIFFFAERHYKGVIEAQVATIKTVETERDSYRKQLEDAGITSTSLKKRALILADQIDEFAKNWPINSPDNSDWFWNFRKRFNTRIEKIIDELDEHGQHSAELDPSVEPVNPELYKPENARKLASSIRSLAQKLKD